LSDKSHFNLKGKQMKKIFAILALAITSTAFAASVTVEAQDVNNKTGNDQTTIGLGVKHNFTNTFAGDISFSNTQTNSTNALGTRLEAGVTGTVPLFGSVSGYTRVALGEKYSNTTSYSYYSIEPGVSMPVGPVTVKVGYRFRDAVDNGVNTSEETGTARLGVSYALTKNDSIGLGYDRVRGDSDQKIVKVSYTRGF